MSSFNITKPKILSVSLGNFLVNIFPASVETDYLLFTIVKKRNLGPMICDGHLAEQIMHR